MDDTNYLTSARSVLLMLYTPFPLAWVFVFLAVFCLFFNTGPSNTAVANVTKPTVRATAYAVNILVIHALGDAISPAIIGAIADRSSLHTGFLVVSTMMVVGGNSLALGSAISGCGHDRRIER